MQFKKLFKKLTHTFHPNFDDEFYINEIIVDLETIIKYQNTYLWTLEHTIEAFDYRAECYDRNEAHMQELILGLNDDVIELSKTRKERLNERVKKFKKLPKEERRYGPIKLKSKS